MGCNSFSWTGFRRNNQGILQGTRLLFAGIALVPGCFASPGFASGRIP
jgi:hypothetical protein